MLFFQNLPFLGLLSLLLATSPFTSASVPEDVIGLWRGNESILWIERVGTTLEAVIIAIRPIELAYHEVEEAPWPTGTPRRDDLNPDPKLRARYIMGLNVLADYRFDQGRWQGKIYDPRSGNNYSSTMKVNRNGELQIRGYIGTALFGRTVTYRPLDPCMSHGLALGKAFGTLVACTKAGV